MKDNIVYFVADQMRNDSLHHMGCKASITPNFDQVLKEGVSFENAYCQNPVCVPSRNSFLSGLYPHTKGHRTMHYLIDEDEPMLLKSMKENGYEVIWVGRNDIVPANRSKEKYCDVYFDGVNHDDSKTITRDTKMNFGKSTATLEDTKEEGYYSHYIGEVTKEVAERPGSDWALLNRALEYLESRTSTKPFFLYLTISFPHPPYHCEQPWLGSIDRSLIEPTRPSALSLDKPSMLKGIAERQNLAKWGKENFRELRATYLAMVSRVDHQYGLLRDKLKELNYYDNSNIFIFSDHGDYTGDYDIVEKVQNCFEDPITRVPLIVKPAKGMEVRPRKSKALVELIDVFATVLDLGKVSYPNVHFGKSLVKTIAGSETHKDAVFCEGGRIHGEEWAKDLGHGPISHYWPRLDTQASDGPEHTKATMIRMGDYKFVLRLYEKDEFYDLIEDPLELNNAIDDPKYAEQINDMKLRMLQFYQETGDIVPNRQDLR